MNTTEITFDDGYTVRVGQRIRAYLRGLASEHRPRGEENGWLVVRGFTLSYRIIAEPEGVSPEGLATLSKGMCYLGGGDIERLDTNLDPIVSRFALSERTMVNSFGARLIAPVWEEPHNSYISVAKALEVCLRWMREADHTDLFDRVRIVDLTDPKDPTVIVELRREDL